MVKGLVPSGIDVDKKVGARQSTSFETKGNLLDIVYVPQTFGRDNL